VANIKSAKKRILVNQTKADRNKAIKSAVKTAIKKVRVAIEANDQEAAKAALINATAVINKLQARAYITRTMLQERFPVLQKLLTRWLNQFTDI